MITSAQFNLPINLLSSLCYVESKHDITAVHHDDGGSNSLGVCQIKLTSAKDMGFKGNEQQLMQPQINIFYAGKFLANNIKRYHGNLPRAITSYNKGRSTGTGYSLYYKKVFMKWSQYEPVKIAYAKNP